ncbi:hypothetical protein I5677_05865 [Mobilitalea sibirica]|uniref:PCI domain-containing protein n=1 Tax=Mobilitalea sibirica TaxID=1462919 RepID=A0A8J7H1R3_9FIRM|nr:hypothetical protein [Mobilitalea sibirica]MBH1940423.1 hypothetical protein [Mobilitalea sibirica]
MFQDNLIKNKVIVSFIYGVLQIVSGGVSFFIFGLTFLDVIWSIIMGTYTEEAITVIVHFVFAGGSLVILMHGIRRVRLITLCKHYMRLLSVTPSASIEQLAELLVCPVPVVRSNIIKMIQKRYISSVCFDVKTNSLIDDVKIRYRTVKCKNCGGKNKIIKGSYAECEFCKDIIGE